MCGRMTLTATEPLLLAETFALVLPPDAPPKPRWNIAPTQDVLVVTGDGPRRLEPMRWGLVPPWAADQKAASRLFNARADTVAAKPSFRAAFKRRRALIAADGWYEWTTLDGVKRPWHFHRPDRKPFAIAGLWETYVDAAGVHHRSCCVLTTEANRALSAYHDRMPVVVPASAYDRWLAPSELPPADAALLLAPCPEDWFVAAEASLRVGAVRNDGPELLDPAG
jgi:putative SOS response-associated peptidase YedK